MRKLLLMILLASAVSFAQQPGAAQDSILTAEGSLEQIADSGTVRFVGWRGGEAAYATP